MSFQVIQRPELTAWLTASVAMANNPAVPLGEVQRRLDSMTDALSEDGHRLARDVSETAMHINMFRNMPRPLPDWTPVQQADPEGTLRQFAMRVFQQVAEDSAALAALEKSDEFFMKGETGSV